MIILKRDLICYLRLLVDSLPRRVRDSKLLFKFAKVIFKLPDSLYTFRSDYREDKDIDLRNLYTYGKEKNINRVSSGTDINSKHLKILLNLIREQHPKSIIDIGCGTGFLLSKIRELDHSYRLFGIDFNKPILGENLENINNIKFE